MTPAIARYIETTAKRGYRFLAPVDEITSGPQPTEQPTSPPIPASQNGFAQSEAPAGKPALVRPRSYLRYFALVAFGIVIFAVAMLWRTPPRSSPVNERRITANPVEAPIRAAAVSPDGKYLAYSDPTGTYLRQIDNGETRPLPLPKDFKASPSSWFPDSTHLLVTARDRSEQKAAVWKVSILGGPPQLILDDGEDGVVSPDGSLIAFFHRSPGALYGLRGTAIFHIVGELWFAASDGQNPHKFVANVVASDSQSVGTEVTAVSWAPDSRRVAYIERHKTLAHSRSGDESWLLTRSLAGEPSQLILRDRRLATSDLCWTRDGRILYALRVDAKNPRGDYGVHAIRIDAASGKAKGDPAPVSNGLGWIGGLSVTADGKRLLLWRGNTLPQVFVSEFDRSTHRMTTPRRLTLDENANEPASWLPDSKSILFLSDRDGVWKLFRQRIDETVAEVAVEAKNIVATIPRLSADGSEILFVDVAGADDSSAPVRLMGMPLAGGVPRLILQDSGIDGFSCATAPAAVCVYNKVVGKTTAFITFDPHTGEGREIARFDGWPGWALSPDGSQLAVVTDGHQGRVQFISLSTGATRNVVVDDWPVIRGAYWNADGRGLLTASFTPRGVSVILDVDLEGKAHVVLESDPHEQLYWAIPSPDGRYAALNVLTGEDNVWMVENF
jgi:WD40 repeat protein